MPSKGLLALTVGVSVLAACSLTTDLSGFAAGGASAGGASSGDAAASSGGGDPSDAGTSVAIEAGNGGTPAEVVPTGGVVIAKNVSAYAAGSAQQHHVHYAKNLGAWIVFYLPAGERQSLRTKVTSDFVQFSDGPTLTLPRPHDNDGRNLDVAYANRDGVDVFHVAISLHDHDRYCYRARLRGAAGTLTFQAPVELSSTGTQNTELDPDGVSVAILDSGRIAISTGFWDFQGHWGNGNIFLSKGADDGTAAWDASFPSGQEVEGFAHASNARSVIAIPGGAAVTWEAGDQEPRPTRLHYSLFDGNAWGGGDDVGFPAQPFDVEDWSQVRTSDGRVHAMRYAAGAYLHRYYDGTGHDGFVVPAAPHAQGDGLVLLAQASSAVAFALDAGDRALRRSALDGERWSSWREVAAPDPTRAHISGNADVLLWERGADLVGLRVAP